MLEPFGQLARLLTRATLQSEKRLPFIRGCFWLARLLQCSMDIHRLSNPAVASEPICGEVGAWVTI